MPRRTDFHVKLLVGVILCAHVVLLAFSAQRHSPTFHELGHVPAGICHWRYALFDLYRVNPPLPRMVATLPLLLLEHQTDWSNYPAGPFSREVIPMGIRFAKANGADTFRIFTVARWACIPFSLLGGWVCYRWASTLWGSSSGLLALTLWCFSPTVLGNGSLVMPDVPAAAMGLAASYLFWKWLKTPDWSHALAAGGVLGVAELCKTTMLVLLVVWPLLWCVYRVAERDVPLKRRWLNQTMMVGAMLAIAVCIINFGYGFAGSFQRLGDFKFQSRLLAGPSPERTSNSLNRFAGTPFASLPVPAPKDYLQGIDRQRTDFENGSRSYLRGEWKERGWWYYYLYASIIKVPLGTWVLVCLAVVLSLFRSQSGCPWRDELVLLFPAVVFFTLVSSQTGFSNHMRYILPAFPYLFVWVGKVAGSSVLRHRRIAAVVGLALGWSITSSLWIYPHSLSYFNELVGGPKGGHAHLLGSNIAWGQDLLCLQQWSEKHPETRPLSFASFGWIDPRLADIEFMPPPTGPTFPGTALETDDPAQLGPRPGWHAVDVNFLHGTHWPVATGDGRWRDVPTDSLNYEYFLRFKPVAMVGYSIYIYHITLDDANRVRRELGLPELPQDWRREQERGATDQR